MVWKLPPKLHLPSGRVVRLSDAALGRARAALGENGEGPFAEALALLAGPGVLGDERGAALEVEGLVLRDLHTLRALLTRGGFLGEEAEGFSCENCGAGFEVAPSSLFEAGPFVDGELGDAELDAPFPFGEALSIPKVRLPAGRRRLGRRGAGASAGTSTSASPGARASTSASPGTSTSTSASAGTSTSASTSASLVAGSGAKSAKAGGEARGRMGAAAETVTFVERTVGEAGALFRAADALIGGRARGLRITPAIVLGMGVVALGGERRTPVLAEALAEASEAAWAKVVEHWHEAAYPRRLFALHRCAGCGARNDLDVPLARELGREAAARSGEGRSRRAGKPFPDLDAFEALVRADAARIYAARGVRNIDLFVDAGVPDCDDGGEPLLGSYLPGAFEEESGVPRPPEVRIYYRTFRSEHEADPGFDVEGEIHETIDHEIEHHLNHLSGVDPMDEEERAAIDAEAIRHIGSREAARRGRQALAADLSGFVRTTWPLWLAAAIATAITIWSRQ